MTSSTEDKTGMSVDACKTNPREYPQDIPAHSRQPRLRRQSTLSHISVRQRTYLTLNEHETVTIGELTDKIGFGWYQVQVFVMTFGALMVESATVAMSAGCVEPISREFEVEGSLGKAGLTGLLYMGIQIGMVVAGPLLDRFGRRLPLLIGYAGTVIFGVCCFFAGGAKTLYVLLFLLGLCSGLCVPCAVIMLSEVVPGRLRGTSSAALGVAFRVGSLWSAVALRIWMPNLDVGPWRWLFVISVAPAAAFPIFSLVSPAARQDSPHYLAIAGKHRSLVSTLNLMAESNRRPDLRLVRESDVQVERRASSVTVGEVAAMMSTYPLWLHYLVMFLLFFCKEFVAAGTAAYWPVALARLHGSGAAAGQGEAKARRPSAPAADDRLQLHGLIAQLPAVGPTGRGQMTAASELVIAAVIGFPGIAIAMWVMHLLPRRLSLAAGAGLTGIGALFLLSLRGHLPALGLCGVAVVQLFFPTWQMVTMLLGSEVFPTQVRGFAFSTVFFVGRFGSEVAQVAVHGGPAVFPAAAACLAVAALSLVQCLPETKDAELANFCTEPQPERVGPSGPDRPADKLGAGLAGGKGVPSYGAAGQAAAAPEAADKEA